MSAPLHHEGSLFGIRLHGDDTPQAGSTLTNAEQVYPVSSTP